MRKLCFVWLLLCTVTVCVEAKNTLSSPNKHMVLSTHPQLNFVTEQIFYCDDNVIINRYYPDGILAFHGTGKIDKNEINVFRLKDTTYWDMKGNKLNHKWRKNGKYIWSLNNSITLCDRQFEFEKYHIQCIIISNDNDSCTVGVYVFKRGAFFTKILVKGKLNHDTGLLKFNSTSFNIDDATISIIPERDLKQNKTGLLITLQKGSTVCNTPIKIPLDKAF